MGDPLSDGYLAGQAVGAQRNMRRLNGALTDANATIDQAQQIIWDYEARIREFMEQANDDAARIEHLQKNNDKLSAEVKRLTEIAADVPRLSSALRGQREISRRLQDDLAKAQSGQASTI